MNFDKDLVIDETTLPAILKYIKEEEISIDQTLLLCKIVTKQLVLTNDALRSCEFSDLDKAFEKLIDHSKDSANEYYRFILRWGTDSIPEIEEWFPKHFLKCMDLLKNHPDDSEDATKVLQFLCQPEDVDSEIMNEFLSKHTKDIADLIFTVFSRKSDTIDSKVWNLQVGTFGQIIIAGDTSEFQKIILAYQTNFFKDDVDIKKSCILSFASLLPTEKKSVLTFAKKGLPIYLKTILNESEHMAIRQSCVLCLIFMLRNFPDLIDEDVDGKIIESTKSLFVNESPLCTYSIMLLHTLYVLHSQMDDLLPEEAETELNENLALNLDFFVDNLIDNFWKRKLTFQQMEEYSYALIAIITEAVLKYEADNEKTIEPEDPIPKKVTVLLDEIAAHFKNGFDDLPKEQKEGWILFVCDLIVAAVGSKHTDMFLDGLFKNFDLDGDSSYWCAYQEVIAYTSDPKAYAMKFMDFILQGMVQYKEEAFQILNEMLMDDREGIFKPLRVFEPYVDKIMTITFDIMGSDKKHAQEFQPLALSNLVQYFRNCPDEFRSVLESILKKIYHYMKKLSDMQGDSDFEADFGGDLYENLAVFVREALLLCPDEMQELENKQGCGVVKPCIAMIMDNQGKKWFEGADMMFNTCALISDLYVAYGGNHIKSVLTSVELLVLENLVQLAGQVQKDDPELMDAYHDVKDKMKNFL